MSVKGMLHGRSIQRCTDDSACPAVDGTRLGSLWWLVQFSMNSMLDAWIISCIM